MIKLFFVFFSQNICSKAPFLLYAQLLIFFGGTSCTACGEISQYRGPGNKTESSPFPVTVPLDVLSYQAMFVEVTCAMDNVSPFFAQTFNRAVAIPSEKALSRCVTAPLFSVGFLWFFFFFCSIVYEGLRT